MDDELAQKKAGRRRAWAAIGSTVVFVGLGLLLAPGLAQWRTGSAEKAVPSPPVRGALPAPEAPREPGIELDLGMGLDDEDAGPRVFDCMVGPSEVVDIGSPITGVIEEILVERSDYVEIGDVVARLEARVEEASVRVARARAVRTVDIESREASLDLDRKREARARRLFEQDAVSLDTRDEVEAQAILAAIEVERALEDRRLAGLQLEQAEATLERRVIRSPVSGFVVERLMTAGEVVDEETMLRIAQIDPLRVETILPSNEFGRMQPGDRAEIVPEAPLDQARIAEVAIVDAIIDGASGTFGVHLMLENPEHDLPAGLRCQVRFLGNETNSTAALNPTP